MGILGKRDGTDRKTENLNLRIDQKLDFAVWFAAQAAGQKKSEWCELCELRARRQHKEAKSNGVQRCSKPKKDGTMICRTPTEEELFWECAGGR